MPGPEASLDRATQQLAKPCRIVAVRAQFYGVLRIKIPKHVGFDMVGRDRGSATGKHCMNVCKERLTLVVVRESIANKQIGDEIRIGLRRNNRVRQDGLDL